MSVAALLCCLCTAIDCTKTFPTIQNLTLQVVLSKYKCLHAAGTASASPLRQGLPLLISNDIAAFLTTQTLFVGSLFLLSFDPKAPSSAPLAFDLTTSIAISLTCRSLIRA